MVRRGFFGLGGCWYPKANCPDKRYAQGFSRTHHLSRDRRSIGSSSPVHNLATVDVNRLACHLSGACG